MSGSQTDFYRQEITGNNMANVHTVGFKADLYQAQSMYVTGAVQNGATHAVRLPNGIDFSDGPLIHTGNDLDVAVRGMGWFAVQDPQGKEAYTKAGDLHVTENGRLVTASNLPVLGDSGPISIPPAQRIEVGTDGTISIVPLEGLPDEIVVLDRLKLVKLDPDNLVKDTTGLMKLKEGALAPTDASLTVVKGALEGSNVNSIDQMINMIASGQEFNAKTKMMQTADNNAQKLAQLLLV